MNLPKPVVSVVTPLYNGAPHIEECLESVAAQTFTSWEHIIVDDCSTDRSVEIVASRCSEDPRLRLIQQERNLGAAAARNAGILAAQGRFVAFLDADDLWDPSKLEKQLAFMISENHAFSHTAYKIVTGDRIAATVMPPSKVDYGLLLKQNRIGCSTVIYSVDQLGKQLMPDVRMRQDYGLWLRILREGQIAYALREPLTTYRFGHASLSKNKLRAAAYHWHILRRCEQLPFWRASYYFAHYVFRSLVKYGSLTVK